MRNLVVFLLLVLTATAYAQLQPIDREIMEAKVKAGVTEKEYVIGIGTAPKQMPDAQERAADTAIEDVYLQVAKVIRAIIDANKEEVFHADVAEHYSTAAQMPVVPIAIPHIVRVHIPAGRSSDDVNTYAVVALNRQEVINLYTEKAERLRQKIDTVLAEGGSIEAAAKQYLGTYRLYEELKEAELIIVSAEYKPNPKQAFEKLRAYMKMGSVQEETIDLLDTYFRETSPLAINNCDAVAKAITTQFEMQGAASPSTQVQIDEFTYGVLDTTTGFAPILAYRMESRMASGWNPILKTMLPSTNAYGLGTSVGARLTGTYWERGNKVTVRTVLRDATNGDFKAVAIFRFNKAAVVDIQTGAYKPSNYENLARQEMIVAQGTLGNGASSTTETGGTSPTTITPPGNQGIPGTIPVGKTESVVRNDSFRLQIKTNKGPGSQTYTIGERMRLLVRVNQPAYIRVTYQQQGRWSQLTDDQVIKQEQVSKWLEIPGNFVSVEPEGIGQLLVGAKTTPFKPIAEFYYEDGHRYIGKRPAPAETLTAAARDAEVVEVQYLLRSFVNEDFKKNVTAVNPRTKSFINTDLDKSVSTDAESPSYPIINVDHGGSPVEDSVGKAIESIYITTVK